MKGFIAGALLALTASGAAAQDLTLFYEEPLGGVYKQWWSGAVIGADPASGVLVFVRGDGKSGDFFGVLSVDCAVAARSAWVAQGGYLTPDSLPVEAVTAIRTAACG